MPIQLRRLLTFLIRTTMTLKIEAWRMGYVEVSVCVWVSESRFDKHIRHSTHNNGGLPYQ